MNFAERFGANLRAAREGKGLSQEDLGLRSGLHRTAVGQLERGERVARTDTLIQLSGALALEPQRLLAGLKWSPGYYRSGGMQVDES
jgi:XRE family transcriptional regulator, regulator of sulfur utilization